MEARRRVDIAQDSPNRRAGRVPPSPGIPRPSLDQITLGRLMRVLESSPAAPSSSGNNVGR